MHLVLGTTQATACRELEEGDGSVTHLPNVARFEFVTPTLTGALGSAFLTVTTPGHNWIFRYYECKVELTFLYLPHPPTELGAPCLVNVVRIGLGRGGIMSR